MSLSERELALHLRFDDGAISGRLRSEGDEERPFTGWLGLLSLLETLRPRGSDWSAPPPVR